MSGWSTGPAAPKPPLSVLAQSALAHYGNEQAVRHAWLVAKAALDKAIELERNLRAVAVEIDFGKPGEGTNRIDIPGGSMKCTVQYRYDLSNKEGKTEKLIEDITAISQQAGFIADRLVKWEPEMSIKEYRLLNPDNPAAQTAEQKKILELLQPVLTIKPGLPQLEFEPAKDKV